MFKLVCRGFPVPVPKKGIGKLRLLSENPDLLRIGSYEVKTRVSPEIFANFVEILYDDSASLEVSADNYQCLTSLCRELGFSGMDEQFNRFEKGHSQLDPRLHEKIINIDERVSEHDISIEELQGQILDLTKKLETLNEAAWQRFSSLSAEVKEVHEICAIHHAEVLMQLNTENQEMKRVISDVKNQCDKDHLLVAELASRPKDFKVSPVEIQSQTSTQTSGRLNDKVDWEALDAVRREVQALKESLYCEILARPPAPSQKNGFGGKSKRDPQKAQDSQVRARKALLFGEDPNQQAPRAKRSLFDDDDDLVLPPTKEGKTAPKTIFDDEDDILSVPAKKQKDVQSENAPTPTRPFLVNDELFPTHRKEKQDITAKDSFFNDSGEDLFKVRPKKPRLFDNSPLTGMEKRPGILGNIQRHKR